MAKEQKTPPPPKRKEPSIIGKLFGWMMSLIAWVLISLILSVFIEWIGIAFIWPEQGSAHSEQALQQDYHYLNERVAKSASILVQKIQNATHHINQSIAKYNGLTKLKKTLSARNSGMFYQWLITLEKHYKPYIDSAPYTIQIFFVRLAIVILSMPAFVLFGIIGMVDGLVERDLRRWGGGRESSVMYNIARKSMFRFFITACVVYISIPVSVAPSWIIIPFAGAFGGAVRITFERFKKYL